MGLRPELVDTILRKETNSLKRYLYEIVVDFFQELFSLCRLEKVKDSIDLFVSELVKIEEYSQDLKNKTCKKLLTFLAESHEIYNFVTSLKTLLTVSLCLSRAAEEKSCEESIMINAHHLHDLLYSILKFSARDFQRCPGCFEEKNLSGSNFLKREQVVEFVINRSIEKSLVDFVESARYRMNEGRLDKTDQEFQGKISIDDFHDGRGWAEAAHRVSEIDTNDDFAVKDEKEKEEEHDRYGESRDDDESERRDEDDREDEHRHRREEDDRRHDDDDDEERREREREEEENRERRKRQNELLEAEDLEDDEDRDPTKLSFNEQVEIAPFKKREPPTKSILKPYSKPLIQPSRYDPSV